MSALTEVRRLDAGEWLILGQAGLLLLAVDLALRVLPFRVFYSWCNRAAVRASCATGRTVAAERLAYLVRAAARYVPCRADCLRRSVVLHRLLRHRGLAAHLVIGTTEPRRGFAAHAWVELEGQVLGEEPRVHHEVVSFGSAGAIQTR